MQTLELKKPKINNPEPVYKCKMCGMCCRCIAIHIDWYSEKIKKIRVWWFKKSDLDISKPDHLFVKKYFKRISRTKAKKINPYYYEQTMQTAKEYECNAKPVFYTCTLLKNNKCSQYKTRPDVCRNYQPGEKSFNPDCGELINGICDTF